MLRQNNSPDTPFLHCLPTELIANILLITPGPRVPLSHISSYIRAVSLSTGALWSTIHVSGSDNMEKLAHQLKYSGDCLLNVNLSFDASPQNVAAGFTFLGVAQVICMISLSSKRVQRLTLSYNSFTDHQASQLLESFNFASPSLEILEISTERDGPIPPTFLLGATKKLAHVKIRMNDHFLRDLPQFLTSENRLGSLHLILEEDLPDIIPILRFHAASLTDLDIHFTFNITVHGSYSSPPIVLESLEILHIRCGNATPLAVVTTPHLRHLDLEFYDEDDFGNEPRGSLRNETTLIFDFLRHHAQHLESVSYHARSPTGNEHTEYSTGPIYFPKVHTFRINANVGQRTLLSECRFPILVELAINVVSDLPDNDVPWDLVDLCIERNAHSLRSLQVSSEPYKRRPLFRRNLPFAPNNLPLIDLPLIESIDLQGGGDFFARIASAPRLKLLILTNPRLGVEVPTSRVFPCLDVLSVEDYPIILRSISAPNLKTLHFTYSQDLDKNMIMSFVNGHAASIEVLHLNQMSRIPKKASPNSPPTLSLPHLRIIHLTQQFLVDPPFLIAPNGSRIQAQVTNVYTIDLLDKDISVISNTFPFKSLVVPHNRSSSYIPAIIRKSPLLDTLHFRISSKGIPPNGTGHDGVIFALAMGRPDPETGEWWCPGLRHTFELPRKFSVSEIGQLFDAMMHIIKQRVQPGVAPLESLTIGRAAKPGLDPEGIVSTWRSSSDEDGAIYPNSQWHIWFKENLSKFECVCYSPDDPDWFYYDMLELSPRLEFVSYN